MRRCAAVNGVDPFRDEIRICGREAVAVSNGKRTTPLCSAHMAIWESGVDLRVIAEVLSPEGVFEEWR